MEENINLGAALAYAARGWPVLPIHGIRNGHCTCGPGCTKPGKHPVTSNGVHGATTDEATLRRHWGNLADANVAIAAGLGSGFVILDVDAKSGGYASLETLVQIHGSLPDDTPTQDTGGGGKHYLFAHPGGKVKNRTGLAPGVDVKSDGGYVIVWPSLHETGARYEWDHGFDLPPAPLPAWIEAACREKTGELPRPVPAGGGECVSSSYAKQALERECSELGLMAPNSGRNAKLNSAAFSLGTLIADGLLDQYEVESALEDAALRCGLTTEDGRGQVEATMRSGLRAGLGSPRGLRVMESGAKGGSTQRTSAEGPPADDGPLPETPGEHSLADFNKEEPPDINGKPGDLEMARAWSYRVQHSFAPFEGGRWFQYNDGYWTRVDLDHVKSDAQRYLESIAGLDGVELAVTPVKRNNVVDLARSRLVVRKDSVFNTNPNWIPLKNGIYDTDRGHMVEHHPDNWMTYQLPFNYDARADCPRWKQFLQEVLIYKDGRPCQEWIDLMQEWIGYLMIPNTDAQMSMFWVGSGANGKGVVMRLLCRMFPERYTDVPIEQLDQPYHMARLQNILVGFVEEIAPRAMSKNGTYFKKLTGGNPVSGRQPGERVYDFTPVIRLIVACNELPSTKDLSHGYFRRICLIDFRRQFSRAEADPTLDATLATELPGIFNWALEGLLRLRERHYQFEVPEESELMLVEYRKSQDIVEQFVEECCEKGDDYYCLSSDVYSAFNRWCVANGEKPWTAIAFGKRLNNMRLEARKTELGGLKGSFRLGMRLVESLAASQSAFSGEDPFGQRS